MKPIQSSSSSRKAVIVVLVLFLIGGVLLALFSIPTSAFNGGRNVVVCNLNLVVSGTYNDNGLAHWITGFAFAAGASGCHNQTLLDTIGLPQAQNIFPVTISFSVTLTSQQDGSVHGPYQLTYTIPALNYQYNFQAKTTVANVPEGTYTASITSSVPLGSGSGPTTYQQTISF
jgi:hypothetical protein